MLQDHLEHSLELACLEHFLGDAQRGAIAQAAVGALQSRTPPPSPHPSPPASPRASGTSILKFVVVVVTRLLGRIKVPDRYVQT